MTRRVCVILALPLMLACGPTLLLPGGALRGTPASAPGDWAWTDEVSTIQLETRPTDPYSVNIWVVASDDKLYVHAGANRSSWVEHMEADPRVRVRIEEDLFELSSSRVVDQQEFDAFAALYEEKYGTRPRNENAQEAYLFRLVAR